MKNIFFVYRNLYKSQKLLSVGDALLPMIPVLSKDAKESDLLTYDIKDDKEMFYDSRKDTAFVDDDDETRFLDSDKFHLWNYFVGAAILLIVLFVVFNKCYYARRTRRRLRRVIQAIAIR